MELWLRIAALTIVSGVAAYVLYNHWRERWGENHF